MLGLSGGIDSAVTLAVAPCAGARSCRGRDDAFSLHGVDERGGCGGRSSGVGRSVQQHFHEPMYEAFMDALAGEFADLPANITEENFRRVVVVWC